MRKLFLSLLMCLVPVVNYAQCDSNLDTITAQEVDKAREAYRLALKTHGLVDLGLPSGTLWRNTNEEGFYNYDEAFDKYGNGLPTKEQWKELRKVCKWNWNGRGYTIVGPNGESIELPALGVRNFYGVVEELGSGLYWSSTLYGSNCAWMIYLGSKRVQQNYLLRGYGLSIRLVMNP